ncbi:MAG: Spy/CpxP family protein refolding chaperone [Syntrophobacteraceae bacterium]
MKKKLTGFAIVLVTALWMSGSWAFFNSIASAQNTSPSPTAPPQTQAPPAQPTAPPTQPHHWKGKHGHENFWKQLNLTEKQKKEIKAIQEKARPEMRPLIKELKEGRKKLMALRKAGKFDEAKVRAVAEEQGRTLTKVIVERERTMYQMREVLTPEQRAKLDQERRSWMHHHKHW